MGRGGKTQSQAESDWPDLDLQLSTFTAEVLRARLLPGSAVRPLRRQRGKGRRGSGGWMGHRAEQHSKYISDVPAAASAVPPQLLSPQSSSEDLCIGYQSQRHLNWVETTGAGQEGRGGGVVTSASLSPSLPLTEPQLEPRYHSALMDGRSERQHRSMCSVYAPACPSQAHLLPEIS